jgi:large subunit ribosomal protein L10
VIEEIKEQFEQSESTILVEMHGLSVTEATDLRRRCREADVRLKVYKNTLLRRAVDGLGVEGLGPHLIGPTAIATSTTDPSAAMKVLRDFMKQNEHVRVKAGVVVASVLSSADAMALADLPTYDEGVAMLAGVLQAPIAGLATSLNALLSGLAIALSRVVDMNEAQTTAD